MSTNGLPRSNQADQDRVSLLHKFIWKVNMLLATLLRANVTAVAFIVTIIIYCLACYAEDTVASTNPDFGRIIGYYACLFGLLSNALLVRMLVPTLGSVILVIWVCCFLTVTFCLYDKIIEQLRRATFLFVEKIELLMSRVRSFNTDPNESANEDGSIMP